MVCFTVYQNAYRFVVSQTRIKNESPTLPKNRSALYNQLCMQPESKIKSKHILSFFLLIMAEMIVFGIVFYTQLKNLLRPTLYPHVLFVHILAVILFFANVVVGILLELRSLISGRKEIIIHTYATIAWLDTRFSSPLIIISVTTGIVLSFMIGDILEIG